ncbi:MAG: ComEA family DNA-binding protein [Gammaproteobacteria bacterium]
MKAIKSFVLFVCLCFSLLAHAGEININTADVPTLAKELVGVGKARAEAIVAYRETNGPFKSVDDLARVDGIGNRTLESNRSKIVLK